MYKCFIDDSGTKEYTNPFSLETKASLPIWSDGSESRKFLEANFFVLCWLHIDIADLKWIDEKIKALKIDFFWTENVEIKSFYLRNTLFRERKYCIPYWIKLEQLRKFSLAIHSLIEENSDKIKIIATVFDKRQYRLRDKIENCPLLKSTQVFFERIQYIWKKTIIVFDQMESSLSKESGKHKKILNIKKSNDWMSRIYIQEYTLISDIEFQKSCNDNFLQLADICAYNIRRQFMEHWKIWIEWPANSECLTYEYFDRIRKNFHHQWKKVVGRWLVLIPDFQKIQWNILS